MLSSVKKTLRITNDVFDDEIQDLIDAAKHDLMLSGVSSEKANDETDPLIKRAVVVYCKANFGLDNPESEKLQQSYDSLKRHLTLSQEYTPGGVI